MVRPDNRRDLCRDDRLTVTAVISTHLLPYETECGVHFRGHYETAGDGTRMSACDTEEGATHSDKAYAGSDVGYADVTVGVDAISDLIAGITGLTADGTGVYVEVYGGGFSGKSHDMKPPWGFIRIYRYLVITIYRYFVIVNIHFALFWYLK